MKMLLTFFLFLIGSQTSVTQMPAPEFADIVLLVDSSDSLGDKGFSSMKTFISRTINQLTATPNQYRIALAQYSDDLQVEFLLDAHKTRSPMLKHVNKNFVFRGGSVRTGNALRKVHETYFKRPTNGRDKNQILVVLASGKSEDDIEEPANILKSDGVKIIALGIKEVSVEELQSMATPKFSSKFRTMRELSTSYQNMNKIIEDVIQTDINGIIPTNATKSVPVTSEVCESNSVADIAFIVDEGVSKQESEDIKKFLKNTVSSLDVRKKCIQIALMTYSSEPYVLSSLSVETNKTDILQKIQGFSPREGKANTGAAINATKKQIFDVSAGSRRAQGIEQIAVLITHRSSEDNVSEAAHDLRRADVTVFAIGIEQADDIQLAQIASYPQRQYVTKLKAFSELPGHNEILKKKLLNQIQDKLYVQSERRELLKTGCVETEEADIYVLIDGSSSIHPTAFGDIKTFLKEVIKMFNIGPSKVRFGAVQYSHFNELEFELNAYNKTNDLLKAIDNIRQVTGDTYIGAALTFMQPLFKKAKEQRAGSVPCHLIVLTDGESHDSVKEPAERLRDENINIYAIGVKGANKAQLHEIAGPKNRTYFVHEFDSLKGIKNEIVQGICSGEACKEMKADIMFLVDSSGSIGSDNFLKMKNFMRELVMKSDIGADKVQVGVVQFSGINKEEFQLDRYASKSDIFSAIDGMSLLGQNTLTGGALTFVSDYFKPPKGARPGVKKFLILITDGEAQDDVKNPAIALRNQSIVIYSVGVFNANKTQLEEISGKPQLVFYVETFDILKHLEDEIIFGICSPYEVCKRIERLDVVFVIDGSGSISSSQYESMKNFMIAMVNKSDVAPDRVQFGAVKYSDEPKMFFYLNKYSTKSEIVKAIWNDTHAGGSTYTAKAVGYSEALFAQEHGSRKNKGVPQILIVITDGDSHDKEKLGAVAKRLRDNGIIIYAVGIKGANPVELLDMAGSKDKYFYVDTFEGLKHTSIEMSEKMCNDSKPECEIQADLVFLIDGSGSIIPEDFSKIKNFLEVVVDQMDYDHVQVGIAQFSDQYRTEFSLEAFQSKPALNVKLQNIKQIGGGTYIGAALKRVKEFFTPAGSKRRRRDTRPILLVVTDGASADDVAEPAQNLRMEGVDIYAVGVGNIDQSQLRQIAGVSKKYTVDNFNDLKIIKKRLVDDICKPVDKTTCFVDIVVGFDISSQKRGDYLFHGQSQLEAYLPDILKALTSLRSLSCTAGAKTQSSVAVHLNNTVPSVPSKFQVDSDKILNSLIKVTINKPSYLTGNFLESLWKTFPSQSDDQNRKKVLLVFSDGLDEDVEELKQKSEELRKKGLDALITVVLEGASKFNELQYIEFGKGFEYMTQLTIGMRSIANTLSTYVTNMAERKCCFLLCKCTGEEGATGDPGKPGVKGSKGLKGHQGFLGEDGEPGPRGQPGPDGEQGTKGCDGSKGPKGDRGLHGQKGDDGFDGIDGINGEQGSLGYPGKKGEKGDVGDPGSPGPRGLFGEHGEKGFRGNPGDPGLNNDVRGRKGSKGERGRPGERGPMGTSGLPGSPSTTGTKGRRGPSGPQGEKGTPGLDGFPGEAGFQGPQGLRGIPGVKGEKGSQGHKGLQCEMAPAGPKGNTGNLGMRGNKGEFGNPGEKGQRGLRGPRGMQGDDGTPGYGAPGKKGAKGQEGFPGDMGLKGEIGEKGDPGEFGSKGINGNMGVMGLSGEKGETGTKGPSGRRGSKGTMGPPSFSPCELIDYVRRHSPCWEGKPECPVYPTELVFALDMSQDVTSQLFERMREIVISVVNGTKIRESNCPVGAKVAVVSYNSNTHHLIRFSEFYSKNQLLKELKNLIYQRSSSERDIGSAMRFIARNIFKRTLQGSTVRKIAVFFSNGQSADEPSINTAVLEYSAFDIVPVVIAFNDVPDVSRAFALDDTGLFQIININQESNYEPLLERFWVCTLCYDKCKPDDSCERPISRSPQAYMDAAFILDSSLKMNGAEFKKVKDFLTVVLDNFEISSEPVISSIGDRVAVVSHSPPGFKPRTGRNPVKTEFDFVTFKSRPLMKRHIQASVQQLNGAAALGHAIQWTINNVFLEAPNLRQHKAIIVISAGETSQWDKEILKNASLTAKCQGYAVFVISLGHAYNYKELEELASIPMEHHLVQLGRVHKPELEYAARFMKPFVHLLRNAINKYPPVELRRSCMRSTFRTPVHAARVTTFLDVIEEVRSGDDAIPDTDYATSEHSTRMFQDFVRDGPLNTSSHHSWITTDMTENVTTSHGVESDMAGTEEF